jgi:hypothetical protein
MAPAQKRIVGSIAKGVWEDCHKAGEHIKIATSFLK